MAADTRVHIVKDESGSDSSCTGYRSQSTPPAQIRVLVYGSTPSEDEIVTVPFEQYVENALPNEWIASWDGEAIKAGAVAVKSYAWFWVTHMGGYLDKPSNCFDVTDDSDFQVYRAGSAMTRTNDAVEATWSVVARKSSTVLKTSYICTLPFPKNPPDNYCATNGAKEKCGAGANGSQLSQFGSQACAEAGESYRTILSTYYSKLQLAVTTSGRRQLLIPNDFNFQGGSNPAVFDPVTGAWTIHGYDAGSPYHFGTTGDIPTVTNDGDGWATIGVFRPSVGKWYFANPFTGGLTSVPYGAVGDLPVQAHYHGISKPTDIGVFRRSTGTWYIKNLGKIAFGGKSDVPVPGHYSGTAANDYADEIAVFRPASAKWYIKDHPTVHYGQRGDIPAPADYNGDGTTDIAIYRPSTLTWYVRGGTAIKYGAPGDVPVSGDFNGDGMGDVAMYRPSNGTLYVHGLGLHVQLGDPNGIPIGAAPYTD